MHNHKKTLLLIALSITAVFWLVNGTLPLQAEEQDHNGAHHHEQADTADAHVGHDHNESEESEEHDEHAHGAAEDDHDDHDHGSAEDEHEGHSHDSHSEAEAGADVHDHEEGVVFLTQQQQKNIGIELAVAGKGEIPSSTRLTGQIRLNDDRLAHISALTPGIVRQVNKSAGAKVKTGDVLAWIESVELGQAKVEFLDIQAEVGCCTTLLDRAKNVHDNTMKLIAYLENSPTLDQLRDFAPLEMGENRSKLVKAYAEVVLAKSVYNREKDLLKQSITSKQEYLDAENALKKAEAEYIAAIDMIRFQVKQNLLEETTSYQRMELALKGAERKLYVLGQSKSDIETLSFSGLMSQNGSTPVSDCTDPNCEECKKKAELAKNVKAFSFEKLGWYPLKAPFDGTIISKHITLGEKLNEERAAYTIADLATVWVDMDVYAKDQAFVTVGQECMILAGGKGYEGKVSYVSPVLDTKTRTAVARVILDNSQAMFRPGQFITGVIYGAHVEGDIVIPANAVQIVKGQKVVFISDGEDFEMRPVMLGSADSQYAEIISGINPGEKVVTQGAFELKAKVVTSTLDSHAGHGH